MRVALIADDLTGSADSGAQFARAGYRTVIVFRGETEPEEADAVVVDTDSRALDEEVARERVFGAVGALKSAAIVYKKLDSTLRGPVATEIGAALEASGRRAAVVAPAFPDAGRITRDGVQMVHGVPVHRTGFADDPVAPVRESHIPTLLAKLGPVRSLSVREVQDARAIQAAIEEAAYIVADAETDAHLEDLVRAVGETVGPEEVLWAGSAGLARALATVYPGPRRGEPLPDLPPVQSALAVVGSMSAVSREQLRVLAAEPDVEPIALDVRDLAEAVAKAFVATREALAGERSVALYPEEERVAEAGRVADSLAEVVSRLSGEGLVRALVMTGGETAVRVSRRLGARGILLREELEAGVPVGVLMGPHPYPAITKAGGFGTPGTLLEALRFLTGGREEQKS